jgi:hypothetical protein
MGDREVHTWFRWRDLREGNHCKDLGVNGSIILKWNFKRNEMVGLCRKYKGQGGVKSVLVERPEGRRPLGRPRRKWEDNIKMDLQEE